MSKICQQLPIVIRIKSHYRSLNEHYQGKHHVVGFCHQNVSARVQLSVMTDCQLSNRTSQLETLDKIFKNNYLKALENEQNRGYTMIPLTRNS